MAERAGKPRVLKKAARKPLVFVDGLKIPEVQEVPLEDINIDDRSFQYRLSFSAVDLVHSLMREGQKEPVDLAGSKPYRVIDGFRRLKAMSSLGWRTVKALVHRGMSEEEAHKLAFIKNVVRKNLSPMDKANAIYQAEQRGNRPSQLAQLLGLSERQLGRYRALVDFPSEIRRLLDDGTISMGHAKVLSDFEVNGTQEWVQRIGEEALSAKQLKRELKKRLGIKTPGRPKLYMKKQHNGVRMYPFTITRDAPEAERAKVIALLQEAIAVLRA